MTSTTAPAAARSYCTESINAADFSTDTTDALHNTWTVGKMYHVIKCLEGKPVAIVLDKGNGFTEFNVTLETTYRGAWGPKVRVKYVWDATAERGYNETDYSLHDTGTIIVLPTDGPHKVKWDAIESYRQHCAAGMAEARRLAEGTGREWGTWKATVVSGTEVDVTYIPSTGNPAFADKWGQRGYWRIQVQG